MFLPGRSSSYLLLASEEFSHTGWRCRNQVQDSHRSPFCSRRVDKTQSICAGKVAEWAKGLPQPARCVYESGAVSRMLRPSGDRARTGRRDATFPARMLAVGAPGLPPRPDAREAPAPGVPAQEGDRVSRKDRMDEGPQGMARQARIRGPLRAARLRGMPREREIARAQARKARQGHRGARRRGGLLKSR